jgi:hypothetical protein
VILFGEHQWSQEVRELFAAAFPFAEVVPTKQLMERFEELGGSRLSEMAQQYWWVMKGLVALVCPPEESCMMDDDVFILDRVDDALEAFERCDLVYQRQIDWGEDYLEYWDQLIDPELQWLPTGALNTGVCWIRQYLVPRRVVKYALSSQPSATPWYIWEQGLIAALYARSNVHELPTPRYFYPLIDGLPGGSVGYDYEGNPCGFASVHFAGMPEKPLDSVALRLAPQILARKPEHQICPYRSPD